MATKRTTTPRKTAKTIRNLRGTLVHLRLFSDQNEKPYRIELQPRGNPGDTHTVPASLIDTNTFTSGVDVLFEIITKTEADKIQYYGSVGYQGIDQATVVRPSETVVKTVTDMGSDGKMPQRELGPTIVKGIGASALEDNNPALPENAFPPAKVSK